MLFTSIMPTHAEKNVGRRVLFPLKRASIAVLLWPVCMTATAVGLAVPADAGDAVTQRAKSNETEKKSKILLRLAVECG